MEAPAAACRSSGMEVIMPAHKRTNGSAEVQLPLTLAFQLTGNDALGVRQA